MGKMLHIMHRTHAIRRPAITILFPLWFWIWRARDNQSDINLNITRHNNSMFMLHSYIDFIQVMRKSSAYKKFLTEESRSKWNHNRKMQPIVKKPTTERLCKAGNIIMYVDVCKNSQWTWWQMLATHVRDQLFSYHLSFETIF